VETTDTLMKNLNEQYGRQGICGQRIGDFEIA